MTSSERGLSLCIPADRLANVQKYPANESVYNNWCSWCFDHVVQVFTRSTDRYDSLESMSWKPIGPYSQSAQARNLRFDTVWLKLMFSKVKMSSTSQKWETSSESSAPADDSTFGRCTCCRKSHTVIYEHSCVTILPSAESLIPVLPSTKDSYTYSTEHRED